MWVEFLGTSNSLTRSFNPHKWLDFLLATSPTYNLKFVDKLKLISIILIGK